MTVYFTSSATWLLSYMPIHFVIHSLLSLHLVMQVSQHRIHMGKIIARFELLSLRTTLMSSLR